MLGHSVAALLGAIVGFYFTGLALTDPAYRAQYFARVIAEVQQIASVRAVYLAAYSSDVPDLRARTPVSS